MAIITKDITPEESIAEQLEEFTLEVGTHYQESSKEAVNRMAPHIDHDTVVDLGCGDGASTEYFHQLGFRVIGVDVNDRKLELNQADQTVKSDIVSYLEGEADRSIPNIFMHHSLEHLPNPEVVLALISKKIARGGIVYIEVPSNDTIHSVHHATFDSPEDLLPPNIAVVEIYKDKVEQYAITKG